MAPAAHPVFASLREARAGGTIVVAHRGASADWPENTLPAFAAARRLGVVMQEFDVRATRDGVLVCMHDATLDRTTDAPVRLGPGSAVALASHAEIAALDAGSWRGHEHAGTRVPTLAEAIDAMLPDCVPMIEHKAGTAGAFVRLLRGKRAARRCLVQSFDWAFLAEVHAAAPEIALAALGPTTAHPDISDATVRAVERLGAGMVHWRDRDLRGDEVSRLHAAGLLVCTYTTDDELGWRGGGSMGIDAMCTNEPGRMLELRDAPVRRR